MGTLGGEQVFFCGLERNDTKENPGKKEQRGQRGKDRKG